LLYVAMTRAKDTLHLVEPLRHAVVQQPRLGPAYVHAARSRFMTRDVLARLRRIGPPPAPAQGIAAAGRAAPVDVGAKIRAMF
jgi:DNA helicase-2/ATP-dependent DNA helicase PcrA